MRTPDEVEAAWIQANAAATTTSPGSQDGPVAGASGRLRRAPSPTTGMIPNHDGYAPAVTTTNDTNHVA